MSDKTDPHSGEAMVGPHGLADDHGATHGHDDHAHDAEALGPLDVRAWGAGLVGILLGLVVMVAFIQAAS